ncbi:hypothetical protein [uncultured Phenylobacterium sp.]|uniref:hypothetical protein n=1 Tax=uncultured Phenylobacterium sp. TaxID=349273 RepID=UPI0025EF7A67|nr:hypothetical protein [uncultured Phenylobacterium sp.]
MSLRQTFLLLVAPLFLLLAGINGALLYFWERAEAAQGLEDQAVAAAVTTAAFASGYDDLAKILADPRRDAAFVAAGTNVAGLVGLYVVAGEGPPVRIAGRGGAVGPPRLPHPVRPTALPITTDAAGRHLATAVAPASGGRYVIAQIDAEPLYAQVAGLERLIAGLVAAAAIVGFGLAWMVAGRIRGELGRNRAAIDAIQANGRLEGAVAESDAAFGIRETRDLAHAVRLMRTGVDGRLARGARELAMRDRRRDEAVAVAAFRETAFPPLATQAGGADLAVRMLGTAPAGTFYALASAGGRAGLVLGECAGATPAEALARALAARRFFERALLDGVAGARVAQGQAAFALSRVAWTDWAGEPPVTNLALLDGDNDGKAAAYVAQATGLSAAAIADDLAALLAANGVLAVLKAASAQPG